MAVSTNAAEAAIAILTRFKFFMMIYSTVHGLYLPPAGIDLSPAPVVAR
jgi:hypothetical protein